MDQTITLEIPEEEVTKLKAELARLLQRMQEVHDEHEARQSRIAQLSAETDAYQAATRRSLANVEQYLSTPSVPFYL